MPKKIFIFLVLIFLIVFWGVISDFRRTEMVEAAGPIAAMKTRTDGYFYVPDLNPDPLVFEPPQSLKVDRLFNNPDLEGDQGGASGEYSIMPDGKVDLTDQLFINLHFGEVEGDPGWEYMADIIADKKIDLSDHLQIGLNFGESGFYINDLTGVTIKFDVGGEVGLNAEDKCNIPVGATSFTVKKAGAPIGAYILFYAAPGTTWPHIKDTLTVPVSVNVGDEFSASLTYTHDAAETGGIHLRWLDDRFDITDKAGCDAEYYDNPVFAPGWEGIECSGLADGTTKTFKLKALVAGDQTLYYRAWDDSRDYDCGTYSDYNRDPSAGTDPTKGSCTPQCHPDEFPERWEECDPYSKGITVTAVCGNGVVEAGEVCDDGNNNDCDGCKGDCSRLDDVCGDSITECGEECDPPEAVSAACGGFACQADCTCFIPPPPPPPQYLINPLACDTIPECIEKIINFIFWVALAIVPIIIIIAGFLFLTSGGDPEKVRTAKRMIFWAVIGLAIILFAKGIISLIKSVIEG